MALSIVFNEEALKLMLFLIDQLNFWPDYYYVHMLIGGMGGQVQWPVSMMTIYPNKKQRDKPV